LDSEHTLLQQTLARLLPLVPAERILISTGAAMLQAVREQAQGVPLENFLVEPTGRNTAPCLAWASWEVKKRGGDVLLAFPADQRIGRPEAFRQRVQACVEAAGTTGDIVLLGQSPDRPHTGYGYIQVGEQAGTFTGATFHRVAGFLEKPDRARAEALLEAGGVLWNGGMFAWSVEPFLARCHQLLPGVGKALSALDSGASLDEVWPLMEVTSIDYGILEHTDELLVVSCDFDWSDLGSWTSVEPHLAPTELGAARVAHAVGMDSGGNIVDAPGKLVAMLGVDDLIVVDTDDVLLIARKDRAQDVRKLIDALKDRDLKKFL